MITETNMLIAKFIPRTDQVAKNAETEVPGVATKKASTGPSLAPFLCRLTATGSEPQQQMGSIEPTSVARRIDFIPVPPRCLFVQFSGINSLMIPLMRKPMANAGPISIRYLKSASKKFGVSGQH